MKKINLFFLVFASIFIFSGCTIEEKNQTTINLIKNEEKSLKNNIQELESEKLKTFRSEEMGFEFDYPMNQDEININKIIGETGSIFISNIFMDVLLFATRSNNYLSGTDQISVINSSGYEINENNEYYFIEGSKEKGKRFKIEPSKIIKNNNNFDIIILNSNSFIELKNIEGPLNQLKPSKNTLIGIINLEEGLFPAIIFINKDVNKVRLEEFEKILTSIRLID